MRVTNRNRPKKVNIKPMGIPRRKKVPVGRATLLVCLAGGPFDKTAIWTRTGGTLPFSLREFSGSYAVDGKWAPA